MIEVTLIRIILNILKDIFFTLVSCKNDFCNISQFIRSKVNGFVVLSQLWIYLVNNSEKKNTRI